MRLTCFICEQHIHVNSSNLLHHLRLINYYFNGGLFNKLATCGQKRMLTHFPSYMEFYKTFELTTSWSYHRSKKLRSIEYTDWWDVGQNDAQEEVNERGLDVNVDRDLNNVGNPEHFSYQEINKKQ